MGYEQKTCGSGKCGGGNCGSGCGCGSQGCGQNGSSGCEMTDMLMHLSKKAWMELMVEKMKDELQKHNGKKMDKTAAVIVEAANAKWEHKVSGKVQGHEHKEKIKQALMG